MVHAASQEIVAVTAHLPRLAQRPNVANSKRSDQVDAHPTMRTARAAICTAACMFIVQQRLCAVASRRAGRRTEPAPAAQLPGQHRH